MLLTICPLICTLISDLRNQGQFHTLEIFQVPKTPIFFWVSTLIKNWDYSYTMNQRNENLGCHPEKVQVLKTRGVFSGWQPGKILGATLRITFQGAD